MRHDCFLCLFLIKHQYHLCYKARPVSVCVGVVRDCPRESVITGWLSGCIVVAEKSRGGGCRGPEDHWCRVSKPMVVRAHPPFWGQQAILLGSLAPDRTTENLVFSLWAFDIRWSQEDLLFVAARMLLLIYVLLSLGSLGCLFLAMVLVVHLAGSPFS